MSQAFELPADVAKAIDGVNTKLEGVQAEISELCWAAERDMPSSSKSFPMSDILLLPASCVLSLARSLSLSPLEVKHSIKLQLPVFQERDDALQKVDKFWLNTIQNCLSAAVYVDDEDREALESLTAIRVDRNADDPREATLHFDFADNEFFSDKTLTRAFLVKKDAPTLGSDDFEFNEHVSSTKTTIHWKSDEKNLAKKHPLVMEDDEDDGDEVQPGSIFSSLFESEHEGLAVR